MQNESEQLFGKESIRNENFIPESHKENKVTLQGIKKKNILLDQKGFRNSSLIIL